MQTSFQEYFFVSEKGEKKGWQLNLWKSPFKVRGLRGGRVKHKASRILHNSVGVLAIQKLIIIKIYVRLFFLSSEEESDSALTCQTGSNFDGDRLGAGHTVWSLSK